MSRPRQRARPEATGGNAFASVLALGACATPTLTQEPPPGAVFFTGAGDIVECGSDGPERTARLLDGIPGLVWTVGDNGRRRVPVNH